MQEPPRHLARRRRAEPSGSGEPHQRITLLLSALLAAVVLTAGGIAVLTGAAGSGRSSVANQRLDQQLGGPAVATLPPGVVGVGIGPGPGPSATTIGIGSPTSAPWPSTWPPGGGGARGGTGVRGGQPARGPATPVPAPAGGPGPVPTSTRPSEQPGTSSAPAPTTAPPAGETTTTTQPPPTKSSEPGLDDHGA